MDADDTLTRMTEVLVQAAKPKGVMVFGSRARAVVLARQRRFQEPDCQRSRRRVVHEFRGSLTFHGIPGNLVRYHEVHTWKILVALGWSPQRPAGRARRRGTPVLEFNFNCKTLSAVAGITSGNFYCRLYPGSVKSQQVIDFLPDLVRHIDRPLLIVWDRLAAHRSPLVRDHVESSKGWIHPEYLPLYVPELIPVQYIWGYRKQHELPNVAPEDYWQLSEGARRALRRTRRRLRLITTFWKQSSL